MLQRTRAKEMQMSQHVVGLRGLGAPTRKVDFTAEFDEPEHVADSRRFGRYAVANDQRGRAELAPVYTGG